MFKRLLKIVALAYIYQLTKFGDFMSCGSKDKFKNIPCVKTHREIVDLVIIGWLKIQKLVYFENGA